MQTPSRLSLLEFLPPSIFGAVMGLSALSFAWRLAGSLWGIVLLPSQAFGLLAVLLFCLLSVVFAFKYRKYSGQMKKDFDHPVTVSFYGTLIISCLLIPGLILPFAPQLACVIWSVAALCMFVFAWHVLRKWIDNRQLPENAMPAWVIPIVGTLDVPVVGIHLPIYGVHEICMVFFGIGFIFGLILLVIIISRLFFQAQLPEALQPTLVVLTGPLALAFSDYEGLTGSQDMFASAIFYFNLFLLLLFVSKIWSLPKICPFYVSWWSISFPLAAVTIAAFHYAEHKPAFVHQAIAGIMLVLTTLVVLFLGVQSLYRIFNGTFAAPRPAGPVESLNQVDEKI